jgi:hypothetical protein
MTPIAKRLRELGFVEDNNNNGLFEKQRVPLGVFFEWFNLNERNLEDVVSAPMGVWMHHTEVEGNPTFVEHEMGRDEQVTTNMLIRIVVNVGYARPEALYTGMAADRLSAALSLITARPVPSPAAEGTNAAPKLRFILPDGRGLEASIRRPEYNPHTKPDLPVVVSLTVGEAGKGFTGWNQQKTQPVERLNISQYRHGNK